MASAAGLQTGDNGGVLLNQFACFDTGSTIEGHPQWANLSNRAISLSFVVNFRIFYVWAICFQLAAHVKHSPLKGE
jgi:hypothetical protein